MSISIRGRFCIQSTVMPDFLPFFFPVLKIISINFSRKKSEHLCKSG